MERNQTAIEPKQTTMEPRQTTGGSSRSGLQRWLWPLRSRKVQVGLATVLVAYLAQAGVVLSEETVLSVMGVGMALILGIAHEDAGRGS